MCGTPGGVKLLDCARCGMVAYCGKECQRAAWPEHKEWCKMVAEEAGPSEDNAGKRRILFDRAFGGAVSLLVKHGTERYPNKRGIVHVQCSHELENYCGRRRSSGDGERSMTLTYMPEGAALENLRESNPSFKDQIEIGLSMQEFFAGKIAPILERGEDINSRVTVVAFERKSHLDAQVFLTYFSPDHPAHKIFQNLEGDSDTVTLKWDVHRECSLDLQWVIRNAIGAQFFQQCSLAWQAKRRNNDMSPWPGGVVTPPLALGVNITALPNGLDRLV
mmetsp:Transcript_3378/g.8748  ORF Transcript_3378/g.8748 Transcript_3378/m.8748 type:complete len:276 (-) Transcript_3378:115-942(-)